MNKILVAALILVAIYMIAVIVIFFKAVVRRKWDGQREIKDFSKGFAKRYAPYIIEGQKWIFSQKWERIEITSYDGLRLVGHFLPAEDSRRTIIMFHGFRSNSTLDFCCAYEYYNSLGLNILTVDQRAHGESGGKCICYGVKERYDCKSWAEYARGRFGADHDLFLAGISMGCTTVLLAAALELPDNVRAVVADCGFTSAWEEFKYLLRRDHMPAHPLIDSVNFVSKLIAGFGFKCCSTLDAVARGKYPIFFAHGANDSFVPTFMTEKNYAACTSEKELLIVPDAGHGASYLVDTPRYQEILKTFIERYSVCGK